MNPELLTVIISSSVALLSALIGGASVAIINNRYNRAKTAEETNKLIEERNLLQEEANKMRAETEKVQAEAEKIRLETAQMALKLDDLTTTVARVVKGQGIEVVVNQRIATPQDILDLKYKAFKVDIVGVSLNHVLEELVENNGARIISRLLSHNLRLRLFMMHPNSPYLSQRAIEDNRPYDKMVERQKRNVELCVEFYNHLKSRYNDAKAAKMLDTHTLGSLQIKLLSFCPYISLYRIDEDLIFWGLYTSGKPGLELPLYKTSRSTDDMMYRHLHQHIYGLLERDKCYPDLVSMVSMGEPELDNDVLKSVI
jgi:hypothetical protein